MLSSTLRFLCINSTVLDTDYLQAFDAKNTLQIYLLVRLLRSHDDYMSELYGKFALRVFHWPIYEAICLIKVPYFFPTSERQ